MPELYKSFTKGTDKAQLFQRGIERLTRKRAGFTLTELAAVLIIITAFILVLMPLVLHVREKANIIACEDNIEKISLGLKLYASEHQGKFPISLSELTENGYVDEERVFDCPSSSHIGDALEPDYHYVTGYSVYSPSEEKIVFDKKENHKDGIHVLYVSGDITFEKTGAMAE